MTTIDLFADVSQEPDATRVPQTETDPIQRVIDGIGLASSLSDEDLVEAVQLLSVAYRTDGAPLVSDARFDSEFLGELKKRMPNHPILLTPEEEVLGDGKRVAHKELMLSTEKLYSDGDVGAWLKRVRMAAGEIGLDASEVKVRITPKLDGTAARRYGELVLTRGKNGYGSDISHIFSIGVRTDDELDGSGEIVIDQAFFDERIAPEYGLEHPRNFISGLAGAETLKDYHHAALEAGVCRFIRHESLQGMEVSMDELSANWKALMRQVQAVPYLCDGAVIEVTNAALKSHMGHTSHHFRWQAALKENVESADTVVEAIRLSCGRTGRIVPVISIKPVRLYGVTITNVTAHTASHIEKMGLGIGAKVRIQRAGGVIPFLSATLEPVETSVDLSKCPSCGGPTEWEGSHLNCVSPMVCPAQSTRGLKHFFDTLGGVCNGFGPVIVEGLVNAGNLTPRDVYALDQAGFEAAGISAGVAKNLVSELARSRVEAIPDAIFLGAFGIKDLGRGDSRKVLEHLPIESLDTLTVEQLQSIHGFGDKTSGPIVARLQNAWPLIRSMLDLNFNLQRTPIASEAENVNSPIAGKTVVFTGTMESGGRSDMEANARTLGAKVGSSVTGKTDLLICGENVGASKTEKAAKLGVSVISEKKYLELLASK